MAEGFSTESVAVAQVLIAGHLTAEWIRKNTVPSATAQAIAATYRIIFDEIIKRS